ncbi:hypothetical protein AYK26_04050 [Euryarchaeota archaeon SM23-78]|nr:MAG: hypothetical protein AYK26_04050 [Euryarchaeota archaeon SM23-78]MBW3000955.1 hypothetical protein [Candidatus Woesearchaeota archaeon]
MVENQELEEVVLGAIYDYITTVKNDPSLSIVADDNKETAKEIIRQSGSPIIDKPHKIRIHFGPYIGYGYDFTKTDEDGVLAKEIYERAVKNTKEFSGTPHMETFGKAGTIDDKIGWYITEIRFSK